MVRQTTHRKVRDIPGLVDGALILNEKELKKNICWRMYIWKLWARKKKVPWPEDLIIAVDEQELEMSAVA